MPSPSPLAQRRTCWLRKTQVILSTGVITVGDKDFWQFSQSAFVLCCVFVFVIKVFAIG